MRTNKTQLVRFTTLALLMAVLAWSTCLAAPLTTPATGALAKSGPLFPPDPWDTGNGNVALAKSGPLFPPDPWDTGKGDGNITVA